MWFTEAYAFRLLKPISKLDVQLIKAISMANLIAELSITFFYSNKFCSFELKCIRLILKKNNEPGSCMNIVVVR